VRCLSDGADYRIMSFINFGCSLIAITLIRTRPESPEAKGGGRAPWVDKRVLRKSEFWSLAVSVLISVLGYGWASHRSRENALTESGCHSSS